MLIACAFRHAFARGEGVDNRASEIFVSRARGSLAMKLHLCRQRVPTLIALLASGLASPAWAMDLVVAVPEPGTMGLLVAAGGAAVLAWRNRRK
jgi:hypothetical protein